MIKSIFNLFRLLILFLIFALLYPILKRRSIYLFLKLAGPAFIKLGQTLATRPDLVGEPLAKILANFQDNLKPFSAKKVTDILQKEFGENFDKRFIEFDYTATASASIAQVHKAKLDNGKIVAIKILRPNIDKIVARDIATLDLIIKIISLFSEFLAKSFSDINLILKSAAKSELNLLKEAENAKRLKHNLQGLEGFYVPEVYIDYSTKKVLTIEWINGIPFSDKLKISASNFDKKKIAQNLVISYFTQVYSDGFFHADMHPGNLFLMKNGDIGVVDFGIMGEIDKKTRIAVAEIFIGFLNKDYKRVAQIHIKTGLVPKDVSVDELALSCQKIGETIVGSAIKDVSLAQLLAYLIAMTREYKMSTKPELLLLQKTLLLVEGVGVMIDEDLNMWELARPWVKEWAKKNIGFDAKIRDILIDLFDAAKKIIDTVS